MSIKAKEILFNEEARQKLKEGIDKICDVICTTLGPKGRNIGVDEKYTSPKIINDGKSIIYDFSVKDSLVDMGVALAKQAALKSKDKTGDGTTTTLLILQALVKEGIKQISSGHSPIFVCRGLEKGMKSLIKEINKISSSVQTEEEIKNIATIAASSNCEIGSLIAEAFNKVGRKGCISVEESKGLESSIELSSGMVIGKGYLSSYFVTDKEKMIVEMQHPKILICEQKISSIQDILPLLQQFVGSEKELLIIAEDIEKNVLSTLVMNHHKNLIKVCAIQAPGYGEERKNQLEDLAIALGTNLITKDTDLSLKRVSIEHLGSCKKVVCESDKTIFIDGLGNKKLIEDRIELLEKQLKNDLTDYQMQKLIDRKGNLQGKVAKILIGAHTERELEDKKKLCENSLESTRVALSDGVCVGGGIALYKASKSLKLLELEKEEKIGSEILRKAVRAPLSKLIENTGNCSAMIIEEIENSEKDFGFNVLTERVENLVEQGILDPVKVIKSSLIHAVSIAKVVLFTEALICDELNEG